MKKELLIGVLVAVAFAWLFGTWALLWVLTIHYGLKIIDGRRGGLR